MLSNHPNVLGGGGTSSGSGPAASGNSLRDTITATNTFAAGNVVYNANGTWTLAKADALSTTYAVGVIESATGSSFVIVYEGVITLSALASSSLFYLSDATAGLLTTTAPTATTSFLVPILRTGTAALAYVEIGSPTSLALTNLTTDVTGTLPVANGGTGITSLGTGVATFLGTPSSANLRAALTDETGTGAAYFQGGDIGTPSAGVGTNLTGIPEGGLSLTDITTNNVSTSKHGFAPKLPNDATKYLDGTGAYTVPAGGGGGGAGTAGALFSSTADGTNNASSSDTSITGTGVGSKTTSANYFAAGTTLLMIAKGTVSTAASPDTLAIKIKAGSVVVASGSGISLTALLSGSQFELFAAITCRTAGASGVFKCNAIFAVTGTALTPLEAKITDTGNAVDTTGTIAWDLTAAWSSTTAGDTITGTNFVMYPPGAGMGDPGSNGVVVRTAAFTTVPRTLTGTANVITVTNGDGVSGNPTFNAGSLVPVLRRQTFSNANATVTASTGNNVIDQIGTLSAARTLTLAAASDYQAGDHVRITDTSGTATFANTITIARAGSDTINGGSASFIIGTAYGSVVLESDGTSAWTVIEATVDVQTWTSGGTWTKSAGAKEITAICIGAGGGGGGGQGNASGVILGGGGGGGGARTERTVRAATVGTSVTVTVGSGGGGGTGGSSTFGIAGTSGGSSSFGSVCFAGGGGGGGRGNAAATASVGGSGGGSFGQGTAGGTGGVTVAGGSPGGSATASQLGGAGGQGTTGGTTGGSGGLAEYGGAGGGGSGTTAAATGAGGSSIYGAGGGGSGGGSNSGTRVSGAAGGVSGAYTSGSGGAGGAGSDGAAGGNGNDASVGNKLCGDGGGGGAGVAASATGGLGGNGGFPGGGAGGGGGGISTGGAGGTGGNGVVIVITRY